ncbi:DUF4238 domain-containing protein [Vibrio parahaemolyticus]|uniref:DUF4238 domain-containing protein n=1 Tax=Vibrio parahaemolyticus TaxID=670 RepID=UPI0004269D1E|nr:DUF4238 domain-containing protein [Vibrio parahaemolyticus]
MKAKKQHWVPRFYLKSFTIEGRSDLAWCIPKSKKPFQSNIKDIASKKYLYSPENSEGNRSWKTEDELSGLESTLSKVWTLVAHDYIDLSDETYRKALSLFMANLILRNPAMIPVYKDIRTKLQELVYSKGLDDNGSPLATHIDFGDGVLKELDRSDWNEFTDVSDANNHHFFVDSIFKETGYIAKLLLDKRWSIICSEEPVFVTSDKPVTKHHRKLTTYGYGTKGVIINFPLSPTRCLVLDDLFEEPDGQYYALSSSRGVTNVLTWSQCDKYIITNRAPDDVLAEMMEHLEVSA